MGQCKRRRMPFFLILVFSYLLFLPPFIGFLTAPVGVSNGTYPLSFSDMSVDRLPVSLVGIPEVNLLASPCLCTGGGVCLTVLVSVLYTPRIFLAFQSCYARTKNGFLPASLKPSVYWRNICCLLVPGTVFCPLASWRWVFLACPMIVEKLWPKELNHLVSCKHTFSCEL